MLICHDFWCCVGVDASSQLIDENKHSAGRIIVQPPTMAPHENLFHVEKHYNDTLYKGQRHGTSHTDKEIQAAANLLGRDSVVADERTALRNVKVSLFFIFPYRYGQLV